MTSYDDIIEMEHPRMPMSKRAAQFAPFDAVAGYKEKVFESIRLTERKRELEQEAIDRINEKLVYIAEHCPIQAVIIYFVADKRKSGGEYRKVNGVVKKLNSYEKFLQMDNGEIICFDDIFEIEFDSI